MDPEETHPPRGISLEATIKGLSANNDYQARAGGESLPTQLTRSEMELAIQIAQGIALGCAVFYGLGAVRDFLIYVLKKL